MFIADLPDQLPTLQDTAAISGLEFMQAILDGRISQAPISGPLNYRLHAVSEGQVSFRGTPLLAHTNPMGGTHGGWFGTLLDSCMACAVMTRLPRGSVYTTLEYKVNLLRTIPLGTEIEAIGVADHVGRSTGVAHGEIRGTADGRLYATGSTTCLVMQVG